MRCWLTRMASSDSCLGRWIREGGGLGVWWLIAYERWISTLEDCRIFPCFLPHACIVFSYHTLIPRSTDDCYGKSSWQEMSQTFHKRLATCFPLSSEVAGSWSFFFPFVGAGGAHGVWLVFSSFANRRLEEKITIKKYFEFRGICGVRWI